MKLHRLLCVVCLLSLLFASACSLMPQAEAVQGAERDDVIAASQPIAENIFQAINDQDYAVFSKDFDETMKKALDEKAFNDMASTFRSTIGAYQDMKVEKVERIENLYVVTYTLTFTNEEAVAARLSLREGEALQIAGLWFDSPKLREQ